MPITPMITSKEETNIKVAPSSPSNLPPALGLTLEFALDIAALAVVPKLAAAVLAAVLTALALVEILPVPLAVTIPLLELDPESTTLPTVAARTNTKSFKTTTALAAETGVPVACLFLNDAAVTMAVSAGFPHPDDARVVGGKAGVEANESGVG